MARQIDLDQLMKYPLRRGSEHCDEKNADPRFLNGVESILEWAQTLPTLTPPNEWVSVDDRLPEEDPHIKKFIEDEIFGLLTVLVYNGEVKQTNRFFCNAPKFGFSKTDGWEWASSNVTHWMPLPEAPDSLPPEGEEDNND